MAEQTTVLFLLGYPRSGSTILGNVLGEVEGFFHGGELHYLWERNLLVGKRRCGCGATLAECELWSGALRRLDELTGGVDAAQVVRLQRQLHARSVGLPSRLRVGRAPGGSALRDYAVVTAALYRSLAETTGARVIVDSSKWPAYAAAARVAPGVRSLLVHLVRDVRGVVYSRSRRLARERSDGTLRVDRPRLVRDALRWARLNAAAETACRSAGPSSLRVRYEDFVDRPQAVLRGIVEALGMSLGDDVVRDGTVELGTNHTTGGNRGRFRTGVVALQPDVRWRERLSSTDRRLVGLLSWPTLQRYGYTTPLGPGR